jgi:4-aminobutyrate aminotransferase-like enzyme
VPAPSDGQLTAHVQAAIHDLQRHGIKPAALLVDTIFSSDGVYADPAGFLKPAVEAIRDAGGLFIADEVQPGFARTGAAMWGFQHHGLIPDMVSMGKPMGNGYPVAGLALKASVIQNFGNRARYFNTFGGNAVAAATAMAVLEVIEGEGLRANAASVGTYFRDGLLALAQTQDSLGPLRAAGLFLGQDIVTDGKPDAKKAARVVNRMRDNGVLISATGPQGHVLKIRPPLIFRPEHVDRVLDSLTAALT